MTPNNSPLQTLRQTASDLVISSASSSSSSSPLLQINPDALTRLTRTLSLQEIHDKTTRISLPLKFRNALEELNFHAMLSLLSFGGAYEGKKGLLSETARDTILFGLIGLHLTKADMHAGFLVTVTRSDVSSYFNINPMESVPHESMPAIHIERPGPLSKFVDDLVKAMNGVGERLRELGEPDLAHFILNAMKTERVPTVARLVTALSTAFPSTFGAPLPVGDSKNTNQGQGDEEGFVCQKKALALAGELYHRLRSKFPELDFVDFAEAPGYVTPTIITHLVRLGVVQQQAGGEEGDVDMSVKGVRQLLENPQNVGVLTAASMLALDALALKVVEGAAAAGGPVAGRSLAPLDLSYYLDEVWGKEDAKRKESEQQGQQQGQEGGQQQQQQQEKEQQKEKGKMVGDLVFIPPVGQTVM